MTTCRDTIDLLLEYLDGGLSAEERAHLEEHLHGCGPCESFLATYQATPELCRSALETKMPDEFADRLSRFLRGQIESEGRGQLEADGRS